MSVPFASMAAAVDVVQTGERLEARARETGELLGTARRMCVDGEWSWLVECGRYREVVATVTTARFTLLNAASKLDGAR